MKAQDPATKPDTRDQYIGDGVYVSTDGYHIILDLRAQGSDRIMLEPYVFARLVEYCDRHIKGTT